MFDYKLWTEKANRICFLNKHTASKNEFKFHSHNCYEIIYFLSDGEVTVGGVCYNAPEDTCCIIPPNTEHTELLRENGEIIFIGFESETEIPFSKINLIKTDKSIRLLIEKAIEEYCEQAYGYKFAAEALLDLLLIAYTRAGGKEGQKCKDMNYIKSYIEQYYNQKIDFGELAKLAGYSYDYFRFVFKKKFGCSPQNYLINIRLKNAAKLLKSTNLTCTEIAYNCGFSTSAQMTAMFKNKFNKTPKEIKITD